MNHPAVNIARLVYLLIAQAAGVAIALSTKGTAMQISVTDGLLIGSGIGLAIIGVEKLLEGFTLRGFSTGTFGLGVGLFCAWLLTRVDISQLLELAFRDRFDDTGDSEGLVNALRLAFDVGLFASLGFLGTVLALRSNRDDFAFIVPYVRFRQDANSGQPIVIDTETVMDGRLLGLLNSGFLGGRIIIAQTVLEEIQTLADEGDTGEKLRAQRGLETLAKMRDSKNFNVAIHEARGNAETQTSNGSLIEIAKFSGARLLTVDENLSKIADLQGVAVLNLNDLDSALRPAAGVGDLIRIALVRPGKEEHQAVGYLSDGTMIVVNQAEGRIGQSIDAVITSTLQTATGKMIFAELGKS